MLLTKFNNLQSSEQRHLNVISSTNKTDKQTEKAGEKSVVKDNRRAQDLYKYIGYTEILYLAMITLLLNVYTLAIQRKSRGKAKTSKKKKRVFFMKKDFQQFMKIFFIFFNSSQYIFKGLTFDSKTHVKKK